MKLIVIRHSYTEGNLQRRYIGITDEPLCQSGIELAKQASDAIKDRAEAVYCSPLKRCVETAEILFPNSNAVTVAQLRECSFGIFEGMTHAELANNADYIKWVASEGAFTPPGGESGADADVRCAAAFEYLLNDMRRKGIETAAVVTHGGVIMRIMSQWFGGGIYRWQPENCGGYIVEINGDSFSFQKLGCGAAEIADDIAAIL